MPPAPAGGRYRCYAKVNFSLEILGRRPDGFHDLLSLVHTISLADELELGPADGLQSHVEGMQLAAETNLAVRAARLLANQTGHPLGAELVLRKRTPAAAGLGGGSSDAATALVGLDRLWGTRLGPAALRQLAAQLGSDVPFFLRGGAALLGGRGDQLQPLPPVRNQWLVLLLPAQSLEDKTRRLYAALEPADFSDGLATRRAAARLLADQGLEPAHLPNGFGRAARASFPGLAGLWDTAEGLADRPLLLSGAGPTLFALAGDRADARRLAEQLGHLGAITATARTVGRARRRLRPTFAGPGAIGYP
jgi:4-diphosphocytidyl-2-C-methyl-D-erythritol kinase